MIQIVEHAIAILINDRDPIRHSSKLDLPFLAVVAEVGDHHRRRRGPHKGEAIRARAVAITCRQLEGYTPHIAPVPQLLDPIDTR